MQVFIQFQPDSTTDTPIFLSDDEECTTIEELHLKVLKGDKFRLCSELALASTLTGMSTFYYVCVRVASGIYHWLVLT